MLDNSYRYHDWDEENRLRFVLGENYAGYYGYDAAGERIYKLMGTCAISQMNGNNPTAQVNFEELTLYPNPYIVVSPRGYTKHYYAGSERIATVIGGGGLDYFGSTSETIEPTFQDNIDCFYKYYSDKYPFGTPAADTYQYARHEDIDGHDMADLANACEPEDLISLDMSAKCDLLFDILDIYQHLQNKEQDVYYYHGDHLGSASWITDNTGAPIQYMHYAPFGELVANPQSSG